MPRNDLFLNRNKTLPDIFQYDHLPERFKNQFSIYWSQFIYQDRISRSKKDACYDAIYQKLCIELGVRNLHEGYSSKKEISFNGYFRDCTDIEIELSMLELYLRAAELLDSNRELNYLPLAYSSEVLKEDVNFRFKENGIGYYYTNQQIIRVDNNLLHEETVKQTLHLISNPEFKSAEEEYLLAHEHYKFSRNGESINECLKAFESTMKIICEKKGYSYNSTDTSSGLIRVLFENNFIPSYLNNEVTSLKQLLISSVPTIRNKNSGHGKGTGSIDIPDHLVSFCLYMTGSTIRYLVEQFQYSKTNR